VALPTLNDLKSYLRIESNAEDTLLQALLARAQAMLEGWTDTPITAMSQTALDRAESLAVHPVTSLIFPRRPCQITAVVDANGATVDASKYYTDGTAGLIYAKPTYAFYDGPYTITANVGLSLRADYARLEPLLSQALLDLAADLYQRRTPGASSESAADTAITWDASRDTVARIMYTLRLLKLGVAL
jgi:uncharacterized phiE125 gp8 family phage protein